MFNTANDSQAPSPHRRGRANAAVWAVPASLELELWKNEPAGPGRVSAGDGRRGRPRHHGAGTFPQPPASGSSSLPASRRSHSPGSCRGGAGLEAAAWNSPRLARGFIREVMTCTNLAPPGERAGGEGPAPRAASFRGLRVDPGQRYFADPLPCVKERRRAEGGRGRKRERLAVLLPLPAFRPPPLPHVSPPLDPPHHAH